MASAGTAAADFATEREERPVAELWTVEVPALSSRDALRSRLARGRDAGVYIFELNQRHDIDGTSRRNVARWINHSCDPNCDAVIEDGRITRMYAMRNPHKLGRLDEVAELRR